MVCAHRGGLKHSFFDVSPEFQQDFSGMKNIHNSFTDFPAECGSDLRFTQDGDDGLMVRKFLFRSLAQFLREIIGNNDAGIEIKFQKRSSFLPSMMALLMEMPLTFMESLNAFMDGRCFLLDF